MSGSPIVTQGYAYSPLFVLTGGYNSTTTVTSADVFALDSVEIRSATCLRVRFTNVPKTGSGTSGTRADVLANYALAGPFAIGIVIASAASDDAEVIDLYLDKPIDVGAWVLTVASTVQTYLGGALTPPYTLAFSLTKAIQPPISNGGENALCGDITNLLNPAFRGKPNWDALVAAISLGDCIVSDNARAIMDQLYISTASDEYLEDRAYDVGVSKPLHTGIKDDQFRALTLAIKNDKVTEVSFLKALSVFYGEDSTNAFAKTALFEPFTLNALDTLSVVLDETQEVDITINRADYKILRRAKAIEVAAAINRAFEANNVNGYAKEHFNPGNGLTSLRIYTGTKGLGGSVRVIGGLAQRSLQFGTNLFPVPTIIPPLPSWTVSGSTDNKAILSCSLDSIYNFSQVQEGDYIVISGSEFSPGNKGAFTISKVTYAFAGALVNQTIEITNKNVSSQTLNQVSIASVLMFRPRRSTIYDTAQFVTVGQVGGKSYVSIPTTTQIVNRQNGTAAYGIQNAVYNIASLSRDINGLVTITTTLPHGITGGQVLIENFVMDGTTPTITPGTPSTAFVANAASGTSDTSMLTHWSVSDTTEEVWATYYKDTLNNIWTIGGMKDVGQNPTAKHKIFNVGTVTTLSDGSKSYTYNWKQGTATSSVGVAAVEMSSNNHRNQLYLAGGYTIGPWQSRQTNNCVTSPQTIDSTFATTTVSALPIQNANGALAAFNTLGKLIYSGGWANERPNVASTQVAIVDQTTLVASNFATLLQARAMHKSVTILDGATSKALVIGGRNPGDDSARYALGFNTWSFEESSVSTIFIGPTTVFINANPRPTGKIGYGVTVTNPMVSNGTGQATLNTIFLSNYTICGWFTKASGCVFRNAVAGAPAVAADNTMIAFGVDPSDNTFFIRWMTGANIVKTKKVGNYLTNFLETPIAGKPKFHHFGITCEISGASVTYTIYIDGQQKNAFTDTAPTGGTNTRWAFGEADGSIPAYAGTIDEVGITSTVLTADQIYNQFLSECGVAYDAPENLYAMPVGKVLNSCEIISSTGTVTLAGSMAYARFAFGLVTLPDGRVVVIGGIGYNPSTASTPYNLSQAQLELDTAEIYDPVANTWAVLPKMLFRHSYPAVHYYNGRIYVSGSLTNGAAEYFDVAKGRWFSTASYDYPRGFAGGYGVNEVMVLPGGGYITNGALSQNTLDYHLLINGYKCCTLINGMHTVSSASGSTITFASPNKNWVHGTSGTVVSFTAATNKIKGPYVFDKTPKITSTKGSLTKAIAAYTNPGELTLGTNESLNFPAPGGYIVVSYGYSGQSDFIKYFGRKDNNTIKIDTSYTFTVGHAIGRSVIWVPSLGSFVPSSPPAFYLTDSTSGKAAVEQTISDIAASGIDLNIHVRYPGDRGLGNEGRPISDNYKLSDIIEVYGDK